MSSVCSHEWGVSCLNIVILFSFNFFDKLSAVMETAGGGRDSRSHFCTCFFFFKKQMARAKKALNLQHLNFLPKEVMYSHFFLFFSFAILMSFLCSIFKSLHPLSQTHTSTKERERASLQLPGAMADHVLLQT